MLEERVVSIRGIGPEYLSSTLWPEPLSAPALVFRTPASYEEYEIAVLTTGTNHGYGPRRRHPGEIEEISVRPVADPGSPCLGAQHQNRTIQLRKNVLATCGENVG